MARLYRPHVPLSVRCKVAVRQMRALTKCEPTDEYGIAYSDQPKPQHGEMLKLAMFHLAIAFKCEVSELRLDHDPPLGARPRIRMGLGKTKYQPDANDPVYLEYRPHGPQHAGSHLIKTNVRGDHGQHPDRVLIKKARRLTENKPPKRKVKIKSRGFDRVSRPFKKRSR
jgi:hypothetical protein